MRHGPCNNAASSALGTLIIISVLLCSAGEYAGFDKEAPTSRDGGKPEVVRRLKAMHGYDTVVMIGAPVYSLTDQNGYSTLAFVLY